VTSAPGNQCFAIESKYGADAVKKIGYKRFEYKQGVTFTHTLQLKASGVEGKR
jgi:hypothetical protein